MIQVVDGEIKMYRLPEMGILKNGEVVVDYHLLDKEILYKEGWLDEIDERPDYNKETHYLLYDKHVHNFEEKTSVKKYRILEIPKEEFINYADEISRLKETIDTLIKEKDTKQY